MATPRKHYFRVADSVLRESWTNDDLATLVRLMAYLNQRWARDGLTSSQACRATLSAQDLMAVTGSQRLLTARSRLSIAVASVSVRTSIRGAYTDIHWPKYAEFQGLPSEVGAKSGKTQGNSVPESRPLRNPQSATIRSESESEAARASQAARPPEKSAEPETEPDAPSTGFGAWSPPAEKRESLAGSTIFAEARANALAARRA